MRGRDLSRGVLPAVLYVFIVGSGAEVGTAPPREPGGGKPGPGLKVPAGAKEDPRPAEGIEGRRVDEFFAARPDREVSAAAQEPAAILARALGWVFAITVAFVGFIALYRRGLSRSRRSLSGRGHPISVLARSALSPKHSLYIVRVLGRAFLLGVSGDRIIRLGEFADPQDTASLGSPFADEMAREMRAGAAGIDADHPVHGILPLQESSPGTPQAGSGRPSVRAEVARLFQLVRGWRSRASRDASPACP